MGPLLKLCRSQGKVYPNRKGILWGLLLWYELSSCWHIFTCLGNLHDAWWMRWFLDYPSSPTDNIYLQAPTTPPSPSVMCLSTCTWWCKSGVASRIFLRLCTHGRVRGARFVVLCFINFRNLRNSAEYGVAHDGLSELYFLMNETGQKVVQVTLLMRNMMWKYQRLTHMFNIRYGCFRKLLISW